VECVRLAGGVAVHCFVVCRRATRFFNPEVPPTAEDRRHISDGHRHASLPRQRTHNLLSPDLEHFYHVPADLVHLRRVRRWVLSLPWLAVLACITGYDYSRRIALSPHVLDAQRSAFVCESASVQV